MSKFEVTLETIGDVKAAENSDMLDLVHLESKDYDFITQKGLYSVGDEVIYFPVDSLLPMWLVEVLGLTGKLFYGNIPDDGSERLQNRVKTIKLRGNISQGIVCRIQDILDANSDLTQDMFDKANGNFTQLLGVEKYEAPVISSKQGNLVGLPDMVNTYDIESAQNYPDVINALMDVPVYITEKIEGSHWWISIDRDEIVTVGQRNYAIITNETDRHDWHKVAEDLFLEERLRQLFKELKQVNPGLHRLTFRGEIVGPGIQGNYYKLQNHQVYLFEIEVDGIPMNAFEFEKWTYRYSLPDVPMLYFNFTLRDCLHESACDTIKQLSNGDSLLEGLKIPRKREGIVIKPMEEQRHLSIGRLIIKQRSPEYLAKSES